MKTKSDKLSIKDWAPEDRPREKLLTKGIASLGDAELLAILIRSGTRNETAVELSKKILEGTNHNLNELGKKSVYELMKMKGIGKAKAISIVAALEIGKRRKSEEILKKNAIKNCNDVFEIFHPLMCDLITEEFWVLLLNQSNKILSSETISKGGMTSTVVDIRNILRLALEKKAVSIILCHNHPSGNLTPSNEDISITKKLKEAAAIMDISLLDHLIVADSGFYSFAEEGKL